MSPEIELSIYGNSVYNECSISKQCGKKWIIQVMLSKYQIFSQILTSYLTPK